MIRHRPFCRTLLNRAGMPLPILPLALILGLLGGTGSVLAEQSHRPVDLTLANFQFGPHNRWAFSHLREVLPTANIERDPQRFLPLPRSDGFVDDFTLSLEGREQSRQEVFDSQYVDGLLVIRDGAIVFEEYLGHLTPSRPHLMNSITKSIVGLVAGQLAAEGVIDLSKPVSHYVPALADGGWGPDALQTVMDMKDGSDYTEDYPDFTTTFRLQDCAIGWTDADYCPSDIPLGGYAFFPTIGRDESKLGRFSYRSGSTDVIGWVLEAATGKPLASLISEYVWKPMGAEFDANITVDPSGFALADHGMSATLRDLGRVGLLVLNDGRAFNEQVVSAAFIEDLHAQAGDPHWPYANEVSDALAPYYRSFWWGNGNAGRDVGGSGIHGQALRVAPKENIVIALYSTWPRADGEPDRDFWATNEALLDALVAEFSIP